MRPIQAQTPLCAARGRRSILTETSSIICGLSMKSFTSNHIVRSILFLVAVSMVATVFGADADVALAASVSEADDFGSPLVLAIIVAACLSVLGVAFAVGIFVCIAACVFILFGILTTSAAVAFFRRNPMSGLRALFIQIGAVAGAVVGAAESAP